MPLPPEEEEHSSAERATLLTSLAAEASGFLFSCFCQRSARQIDSVCDRECDSPFPSAQHGTRKSSRSHIHSSHSLQNDAQTQLQLQHHLLLLLTSLLAMMMLTMAPLVSAEDDADELAAEIREMLQDE